MPTAKWTKILFAITDEGEMTLQNHQKSRILFPLIQENHLLPCNRIFKINCPLIFLSYVPNTELKYSGTWK